MMERFHVLETGKAGSLEKVYNSGKPHKIEIKDKLLALIFSEC